MVHGRISSPLPSIYVLPRPTIMLAKGHASSCLDILCILGSTMVRMCFLRGGEISETPRAVSASPPGLPPNVFLGPNSFGAVLWGVNVDC